MLAFHYLLRVIFAERHYEATPCRCCHATPYDAFDTPLMPASHLLTFYTPRRHGLFSPRFDVADFIDITPLQTP